MTKRGHTAQDGRKARLLRFRSTKAELTFIQEKLSTDERRQALLKAAERKERCP